MAINDCFGKLNAGKEIFSTEEQSEVRSLVVNLMSGRSQKDAERAAVEKLLQDAISERKEISSLVREELDLPNPEAIPEELSTVDSPVFSRDEDWMANFLGEEDLAPLEGSENKAWSQEDKDAVRQLWIDYSSDDNAFRYSTSQSKDIEDIVKTLNPKNTAQDVTKMYAGVSVNPEKGQRLIQLTLNKEQNGKVVRKDAYIQIFDQEKVVEINVMGVGEGYGGSEVYAIAHNWAVNNGYVFEGDRAGISIAGMKRRTEQMISQILKYGSSKNIAPHPKQKAFIHEVTGVPLTYSVNSSTNKNLDSLLQASYDLTILDAPEIRDVTYNPRAGQFERAGEPFSEKDFASLARELHSPASGRASEGAGGVDTLKRAALTNTILNAGTASEKRAIVESIKQASIQRLPLTEKILYSRAQEDTPEFKEWFGDSKVVDADGKPLVVYHGTMASDLIVFNPRASVELYGRPEGIDAVGTWFTTDKAFAENFGKNRIDTYLSIKNPAVYESWQDLMDEWGEENTSRYTYKNAKARHKANKHNGDAAQFRELLIAEGFDGIQIKPHKTDASTEFDGRSAWIAFKPTQIKSAIGNVGTFDATNPDIRYSRKTPFYSQLERGLEKTEDRIFKQNPTGKQFLLWLNANAGKLKIQKSEVYWTGLEDWLNTVEGKITKDDIMAVVKAGGIQTVDIDLGKPEFDDNNPQLPNSLIVRRVTEYEREDGGPWRKYDYVVENREDSAVGFGDSQDDAIRDAYSGHPEEWDDEGATKFKQWTVPGGESYRELLITLPTVAENIDEQIAAVEKRIEAMDELSKEFANEGNADKSQSFKEKAQVNRWKLEDLKKTKAQTKISANFKSTHYSQPNILGHLRFDTRTDDQGRKVMFLQELQSDWGQKGKKEGFVSAGNREREIVQAKQELNEYSDSLKDKYGVQRSEPYHKVARLVTSEEAAMYSRMSSRIINLEDSQYGKVAVPSAPFVADSKGKADTDAWVSLLLKKAIAHAVETGHEVIAWANGEQNAEHYNQAKYVNKITASGKTADGTYFLSVDYSNGERLKEKVVEDKLEDYVGKELAGRIIEEHGGAFKDLDLKVGGEGMAYFYDTIVPSNAKAVLAKAGGGKVEMIGFQKVLADGQKEFGEIDKQQGFVITPLLREKVQVEGLPMFSRSGNQAPAETKTDAVARTIQDKMRRFAVVRDWLKEQGHALSEAADVWLAEGNMHGKISTRTEDFRNKKKKPLIEKTQKAGFSMGQVAEYMEAVHIIEANVRMRKIHNDPTATANGVTDKEAQDVIDEYKRMRNFATLDSLAAEWRGITTDTRNILVSSGIISQEMANAWSATYKNYVPLKGDGKDVQVGTGKGLSVNGKTKRRLGHSIRDEAVIQNILRDHERAIMMSEKNAVGLALLRMGIEAKNPELITIDQPKKRQVMKSGQAHYTVTYFGSDVEVFDNLNDARRYRDTLGAQPGTNKLDLGIRTTYEADTVVLMSSPMLADNEVNVYVNGNTVRMQINDELLARAYKNLGVEAVAKYMQPAQVFNRWLSAAYTGYSPEFALVNMMRDLFAGSINLTGDYGIGMTAKIFANYPKAFAELVKSFKDPALSKWVTDYRAAGGSTGGAYLSDIERIGKDLMNSYNEAAGVRETSKRIYDEEIAKGKSKKYAAMKAGYKGGMAGFHKTPVIGHFLNLMQRVNSVTENALRVATYVTLKENGYSDAKAAQAAKMSTVNFNRKGEVTATMGAAYLFFNPNIQGTQRLISTLGSSEHKGQAQAMAGMMVMAALAIAESFRGGDDDEWKRVPQHLKDRNIVMLIDGEPVTIPLPYGYGVFWSMGNALSDVFHGEDVGKVSVRLSDAMFNNFSPVGNPLPEMDPKMVNVMPTVFKMALLPNQGTEGETSLNRPLTPRKYIEGKPDSENMFRGTYGTWYAQAARGMNSATGGDAIHSGLVDISPETIKYWVSSLTGGAGRFITDTIAVGQIKAAGGELDTREIPIIRKFVAENDVANSRQEFYKTIEEAKASADLLSLAKSRAKVTGSDADIEIYQNVMEENREQIIISKIADKHNQMVAQLKLELYKIHLNEKLSLKEKRLQIKELDKREQEVYTHFEQAIKEAK